MASDDVDSYLAGVPEPQRSTLTALRRTLLRLLPDADEVMSYGAPSIKVEGVGVAGYAAYGKHCSYLPMSGSVLQTLVAEVAAYSTSKGALRFPVDQPLPDILVRMLVQARLAEIAATPSPTRRP
jgi:uncharacterized protein YdhG (YjbR/CyaY superfamily)